jgi:hypothetical protein
MLQVVCPNVLKIDFRKLELTPESTLVLSSSQTQVFLHQPATDKVQNPSGFLSLILLKVLKCTESPVLNKSLYFIMDDYSDINVCCVEKFSEFKWNHQTQMNLILIFFLNE